MKEVPAVEQVQRRYDGTLCGAPPNYPCSTRSGTVLSRSHSARYYVAIAEATLPLPAPAAEEISRGRVVP